MHSQCSKNQSFLYGRSACSGSLKSDCNKKWYVCSASVLEVTETASFITKTRNRLSITAVGYKQKKCVQFPCTARMLRERGEFSLFFFQILNHGNRDNPCRWIRCERIHLVHLTCFHSISNQYLISLKWIFERNLKLNTVAERKKLFPRPI